MQRTRSTVAREGRAKSAEAATATATRGSIERACVSPAPAPAPQTAPRAPAATAPGPADARGRPKASAAKQHLQPRSIVAHPRACSELHPLRCPVSAVCATPPRATQQREMKNVARLCTHTHAMHRTTGRACVACLRPRPGRNESSTAQRKAARAAARGSGGISCSRGAPVDSRLTRRLLQRRPSTKGGNAARSRWIPAESCNPPPVHPVPPRLSTDITLDAYPAQDVMPCHASPAPSQSSAAQCPGAPARSPPHRRCQGRRFPPRPRRGRPSRAPRARPRPWPASRP